MPTVWTVWRLAPAYKNCPQNPLRKWVKVGKYKSLAAAEKAAAAKKMYATVEVVEGEYSPPLPRRK